MPTFVLLKDDKEIVDQMWLAQGEFPGQPNPIKRMTWYILREVYPSPTAEEKLEGFTFEIDHEQGIATKTYLVVPKTEAELAATKSAAQKIADIAESLPTWKQVSDDIDAITTVAGLRVAVKKLARVVYWLAKNSAT